MKGKVINNRLFLTELEEFENKMLGEFLAFYFISKKKAKQLVEAKSILINKEVPTIDKVIEKTDCIEIVLNEEVDCEARGKEAKVVYEDDFVLIVHKDAGVLVHDDRSTSLPLLTAEVAQYFQNQGINRFIRPLHRLDTQTQGLVLFSKCSFFQPWFDQQLQLKNICRKYNAIVFGRMRKGSTRAISKNIGRDRHNAKKMIVFKKGKQAMTNIKVLDTKHDYSLVECTLETGRTHQIRVHMAAIGHPIVNDDLYGKSSKEYSGMGLYAVELEFTDPVSKEKRIVKDPFLNNIEVV